MILIIHFYIFVFRNQKKYFSVQGTVTFYVRHTFSSRFEYRQRRLMEVVMNKNKTDHTYHICIICLFVAFLTIGTLASIIYPKNEYSETENRYLTKRPDFTWDTIKDGTFSSQYETYLADQFPYRNQWIGLKIMCDRFLLKQDSNEVYFSKDGYYIEKHPLNNFTNTQALNQITILETFTQDMAYTLGQEHVRAAIIPTASHILQDKLPAFSNSNEQSILLENLKNKLSASIFIDGNNLLFPRKEESIFYRTDHHWTSLGAYYFYENWSKSIGILPYPKNFFNQTIVTDTFLGSVHSKLNISMKPDTITLYKPKTQYHYQVTYTTEDKITDGLYLYSALDEKDKYKIFLGGNHARIDIITSASNDRYKPLEHRHLLIIKDSFANCFVPFAVNHFSKTTVLDLRYYIGSIKDFISAHNITDVLILYSSSNFVTDTNLKKVLY